MKPKRSSAMPILLALFILLLVGQPGVQATTARSGTLWVEVTPVDMYAGDCNGKFSYGGGSGVYKLYVHPGYIKLTQLSPNVYNFCVLSAGDFPLEVHDSAGNAATVRVNVLSASSRSVGTSAKPNLTPYHYLVLNSGPIEIYMNEFGEGYLYDSNRKSWLAIPKAVNGFIQPSYTKVSATMALIYGHGNIAVYDTEVGDWVRRSDEKLEGHYFASITRDSYHYKEAESFVANHVAQLNDGLALAVGTNWVCAYDYRLKKWFSYKGGGDDSTEFLNQNIQLRTGYAKVKILNGPYVSYTAGSSTWVEVRGTWTDYP